MDTKQGPDASVEKGKQVIGSGGQDPSKGQATMGIGSSCLDFKKGKVTIGTSGIVARASA